MTASPARSHGRADWPVLPLALALALMLRVAAAVVMPDQHFPDAAGYRAAGETLWATGRLAEAHIMPLYPALIGIVGRGWGQLAVDIVLSVVVVWLVYRLTLAVFVDRAAAALAAFGAALYPFFVFYAVVGLTETLFLALLLGAFVCWYRGSFAAAACLAVLSILTRPTIDLLAPVLVVVFAFAVHRLPVSGALRQLAVYVLVYCALMSPWWVNNYIAYGSFVRLNLGSGIMFYSGNNPHNQTGGALDTDADRAQFDAISDPIARDRAMWSAGIAYVKDHPRRFIELAGLKFVRFWRPWPYAREYAGRSYVILSLVSFVPVLALTIVYAGLWGWRELPQIAPILLLTGYYTAIHMVFAASLRYRLPLEPFLIVFAATAVARLARRYPAGRRLLGCLEGPAVSP